MFTPRCFRVSALVAYPEVKFFDAGFSHGFLMNTVMGLSDL
jgi:hypothetical protein